jgi:hypothetical protein
MKTTRLGRRAGTSSGLSEAYLDDVAVLEGKVRHRAECATAHDEHLAARQVEETLDIGDIFAVAIALPR